MLRVPVKLARMQVSVHGAKHSQRLGLYADASKSRGRQHQESCFTDFRYLKIPRLAWFIQTPVRESSLNSWFRNSSNQYNIRRAILKESIYAVRTHKCDLWHFLQSGRNSGSVSQVGLPLHLRDITESAMKVWRAHCRLENGLNSMLLLKADKCPQTWIRASLRGVRSTLRLNLDLLNQACISK